MLKQDARYHYGIKKHTCGDGYMYDCWVVGDDYLPLKYIYRQSAEYVCNELQKKTNDYKFYVARFE